MEGIGAGPAWGEASIMKSVIPTSLPKAKQVSATARHSYLLNTPILRAHAIPASKPTSLQHANGGESYMDDSLPTDPCTDKLSPKKA